MYKSKDQEFMDRLKKSIYKAKEIDKPGKEYVWQHMKKHIQMEDLRTYAITKLPGYIIKLGQGDYNVPVVVVTQNTMTIEESALLLDALKAANLSVQDIYCTTVVKTEEESTEVTNHVKAAIYNEIVAAEITIINPKAILIIGETSYLWEDRLPIAWSAASLADCLTSDSVLQKKHKTSLWKALQRVMQYVNA